MDIIYINDVKWYCNKWMGGFWYDCWNANSDLRWCIRPVYRWQQEGVTSLRGIKADSTEWERLSEIVDYIIFA